MGCTLVLGLGLVLVPNGVAAQRATFRPNVTAGPADAKELHPQAKEGDPEDPRRRPVPAGVLPPLPRKRAVAAQRTPRSLETDPVDLVPVPIDRDRFLWPASPRLRTGTWFAVHGLAGRSVRFRKYEPEIVYDKQDTVLMAEVGGAIRLGRFEFSMSLPLVGQLQADFYQKGVVDHEVSKVDRMDLSLTTKVAFPFRRGKDNWLLTPYFTLGVPTGSREIYSTNVGGRTVQHFTAGPQAASAMPGLAAGWRRGMFSAVVSVGILTRVLTRDKLTPDALQGETTASWLGAYQFAFTPWRDVVLILGLSHLHQLLKRGDGKPEDIFWFAPGVRFQPWAGLFGHVGALLPLGKRSRSDASAVITVAIGWEFQ